MASLYLTNKLSLDCENLSIQFQKTIAIHSTLAKRSIDPCNERYELPVKTTDGEWIDILYGIMWICDI